MEKTFYADWAPERLSAAITHLDTLYEAGEDTVYDGIAVSDREYDDMRAILARIDPENDVFSDVTASLYEPGAIKYVRHDPPMTSLSKINEKTFSMKLSALKDWVAGLTGLLGRTPELVQSYKMDGVACRLYYDNGLLTSIGLRPRNGVDGEDITANARFVKGIPDKIPFAGRLIVNGELMCDISDFNAINVELEKAGLPVRANPRNHTSGAIRQHKDPSKTKDGRLRFVAHSLDGCDLSDEVARAKWCNQEIGIPHVQVRPYRESDLEAMESGLTALDYEVDGIVLAVRNVEDQEQCGRHGDKPTGNPRGRIAWKFEEKPVTTTVRQIEWNPTRTGRLAPKLIVDTVQVAGTRVSRVTGNNLGYLRRLCIAEGTEVQIIKSGKIIPKVTNVTKNPGQPCVPGHCPCSRKHPLVEQTGGRAKDEDGNEYTSVDLVCDHRECPSKIAGGLLHYLSELGVKGLGESSVLKLIDSGLVTEPADYYNLTTEQLVGTGDFSVRQAQLACAAIHMIPNASKIKDLAPELDRAQAEKKSVPAELFISSLGIHELGKTAAGKIISRYGQDTIGIITRADADKITVIDGLGGVIVQNIREAVDNGLPEKIARLLVHVLPTLPSTGPLTGVRFVLSGKLDSGKAKLKDEIVALGGEVATSVSMTVNYLVAGEGSGSKLEKARDYGLTVLDEAGLHALLAEKRKT